MSDDPIYTAMREYIRVATELEVRKALPSIREELRKEIPKEGPPGPKGDTGERGADSVLPGPKGEAGPVGERGADGLATREEIEGAFADGVREGRALTLADTYQGVYDHAKTYARGQVTTLDGQPWLAMAETRALPGVSSDWKLFAKKGRDGRDRSK